MENVVRRIHSVKIELRCGSGGSTVIEKQVNERELEGMTMENLLDDFINANWPNQPEKSEISYIDSQTKDRRNIFAAYFIKGQKIPVHLNKNVLECLSDIRQKIGYDGKLEICFLKPKFYRR